MVTGAGATQVDYDGKFGVTLDGGRDVVAERLLVATGRRADLAALGAGLLALLVEREVGRVGVALLHVDLPLGDLQVEHLLGTELPVDDLVDIGQLLPLLVDAVVVSAKFTFAEEGAIRRRWVRSLAQHTRKLTVTVQGSSPDAYQRWEPQLFTTMTSVRVHSGDQPPDPRRCSDADRRLGGIPPIPASGRPDSQIWDCGRPDVLAARVGVVLVLSRRDVEATLDLGRLIDALKAAMIELSEGRAVAPPRVAVMVPEHDGLVAAMPAALRSMQALTTKLVSVFPRNQDQPTHQAVICCFDPATGTPLAMLDGTSITAARTAAGSALATRLLARSDAAVASVVGTGVQARTHALALMELPSVSTIRIAGRNKVRVSELIDELSSDGIPVTAADSIEAAVRAADVVCATTHASSPVIRREWLRPGTHVNSVGFDLRGSGEVDQQTVNDAMVVVESRAAALAPPPSGAVELQQALAAGVAADKLVHAEIGEIAAGKKQGRTDADTITLYKSVGVAVQDAVAAALVLDAARASGVGTTVEL